MSKRKTPHTTDTGPDLFSFQDERAAMVQAGEAQRADGYKKTARTRSKKKRPTYHGREKKPGTNWMNLYPTPKREAAGTGRGLF